MPLSLFPSFFLCSFLNCLHSFRVSSCSGTAPGSFPWGDLPARQPFLFLLWPVGVCPDPVRLWCPGSLPARPAPSCGSSGWKRAASPTCAAPSGAVNVSGSCPAVLGLPDPFACGLCDCFITSACGLLLCAYYRYFAAQTLRFFAAVSSGCPGSFKAARSCPAPSMEAAGLFLIRARVQLFPCSFLYYSAVFWAAFVRCFM